MKKHLIAAAVAAAVAAPAMAQNVSVYGIFDAGVRQASNQPNTAGAPTSSGSQFSASAGNLNTSRFGLRGSEDLGGGLKANFNLESGFSSDGTSSQSNVLFDRRAIVGLSGGWGAVDIGRNTHAGFDIAGAGVTDANSLAFDSVRNYTIGGNKSSAGNIKLNPIISVVSNTNLGTTRADSMVKYTGTFGATTFIYGHAVGGVVGDTSSKVSDSLGIRYNGGQFNLGGSYYTGQDAANKKLSYYQVGGNVSVASSLTATASYSNMKADKDYANSAGVLTVATYATAVPYGTVSANGQSKLNVSHVGLTYQASPALKIIGSYYGTSILGDGITKGKNTTYTLLGIYSLSKRTDLYGSVDTSSSKDGAAAAATNGTDKATGFIAGVRHFF